MQATKSGFITHSSQQGSAMIVSLAILAMLTVAAAVSMQRTTLQVKMVGNMQQKHAVSSMLNSNSSYLIETANETDDTTVRTPISQFIDQEQINQKNGNPVGTLSVSLFDALNWEYLSFKNMKADVDITDTTIVEKISIGDSLKDRSGSREGSRYYMRSTYVGTDENGNTITVEQGFYVSGS